MTELVADRCFTQYGKSVPKVVSQIVLRLQANREPKQRVSYAGLAARIMAHARLDEVANVFDVAPEVEA